MSSQTKGEDTEKFFAFQSKFPWFKFGKNSPTVNIAKESAILAKYSYALEEAYREITDITKKCVELAEKGPSLADDAKDELERADNIKRTKAAKTLPHNVKNLNRLKNLSINTKNLVAKVVEELKYASDVMQKEHSRLPEFGKTLADEGITEPSPCYQRVGEKIPAPQNPLTKEQMLNFPYDEEAKETPKGKEKGEEAKDEED